MMKRFLSIVLRNQFNLFYRFGYTFIPKSQLVEFDGNINDETQENIIEQFKTVTPFEYDEEYLILHLEKSPNNESEFVQFEINDIVSVYPLSQQAKTSIESKIDQRIRLEKPVFETILPTIETEIENKEVEKAISALWTICKIEDPLEKYVANIGLENIFNGLEFRKNGTKADKIQNGNYWEYLIAYDRFDYFPNSTLGYFYDAGQVFAFSKGLSTFEGSGIHGFLEKLNIENPTIKLPEIINCLETEEKLKGYVTQTTVGELKQYIIAPLYLMLRDEIRRSDDISQTKLFKNLDYLKKFQGSFNCAVVLLGAFFRFHKFYDHYYEALNLRFYKNYKEQQEKITREKHPEHISEVSKKFIELEKTEPETFVNKSEELITSGEETISDENKTEELTNPPYIQDLIPESKSDSLTQYQNIIEEALAKQSEMKLTDIALLIKEKSRQKVTNTIIKNVIKEMNSVEIVPKKKPETARRKSNSELNFGI